MNPIHPKQLASIKQNLAKRKKKRATERVVLEEEVRQVRTEDAFGQYFDQIPDLPQEILYELVLLQQEQPEEYERFMRELPSIPRDELYWQLPGFTVQHEQERKENQLFTIRKEVVEGIFTCSRCTCRKTEVVQAQTSRGDEGMTSYIKCTQCGNAWSER